MEKTKETKTGEVYLIETPLACFHAPRIVKNHLQSVLDRYGIIRVFITEENSEIFVATRISLKICEMEGETEEIKKHQIITKAKKVFMGVFSQGADKNVLLGITDRKNMGKSKITKIQDITIHERFRRDIDG